MWRWVSLLCAASLFVVASLIVQAQPQDPNSNRAPEPTGKASITEADVTPPHLIDAPDPEYPPEARAAGHQGTSILSLTVGTDGRPRDVTIVRKLDTELDESAIAAVRNWQYQAATRNDQPVEVQIHARVRFRLYDESNRKIAELWDRSDNNDPKADWALWKAYSQGNGVPEDDELALVFLKMAADWNLPEAQFQMGEHYKNQSPPDYVAAYMWYALSKRAGGTQGEQMLKILAPEMSAEQLSEAEERVGYWPENPPERP